MIKLLNYTLISPNFVVKLPLCISIMVSKVIRNGLPRMIVDLCMELPSCISRM